jgi:hypothetical protein
MLVSQLASRFSPEAIIHAISESFRIPRKNSAFRINRAPSACRYGSEASHFKRRIQFRKSISGSEKFCRLDLKATTKRFAQALPDPAPRDGSHLQPLQSALAEYTYAFEKKVEWPSRGVIPSPRDSAAEA